MPNSSCTYCKKEFTHGYSSTGKFCSLSCSSAYRKSTGKNKRKELFDSGNLSNRKFIKKFLLERDGNKCSVCGLSEWLEKPITLWCDHIDGDASNNLPSNFRLICPLCDSYSPTFGAKNYGKGRKSRGLKQYG